MIQHTFVDRAEEMTFLEKEYQKHDAAFLILYGRRRIGKTEILLQFLKSYNGIYFLASEEGTRQNVEAFSDQCSLFLEDESFHNAQYTSYENLFSSFVHHVNFSRACQKGKIVIIFDEFPYLISSDRSIPSQFQKIWDTILSQYPIMFIVSGSSKSIMESDVLGYKSPLYGRRSGQWRVNPLQFRYLEQFLPWSQTDLVHVYAVLGGIPAYLLKFEKSLPFWENVTANILEKGSYLYHEAELLLNYEFREPGNYMVLLKAIAQGCTTMGHICMTTGLDKGMVSKYLHTLVNLNILADELPITSHPGARGKHYRIIDPYLLFWFRFVYPHRIDLEFYRTEEVLFRVKQSFDHHCGQCFEYIIQDLIRQKYLFPHLHLSRIARWWYQEEEIDIVGIDEEKKTILFCEVKWSDLTSSDLKRIFHSLQKKAGAVRWNNAERREIFCIVARSVKDKTIYKPKELTVYDLKDIFASFSFSS